MTTNYLVCNIEVTEKPELTAVPRSFFAFYFAASEIILYLCSRVGKIIQPL